MIECRNLTGSILIRRLWYERDILQKKLSIFCARQVVHRHCAAFRWPRHFLNVTREHNYQGRYIRFTFRLSARFAARSCWAVDACPAGPFAAAIMGFTIRRYPSVAAYTGIMAAINQPYDVIATSGRQMTHAQRRSFAADIAAVGFVRSMPPSISSSLGPNVASAELERNLYAEAMLPDSAKVPRKLEKVADWYRTM
jgi:hypothetical protein